MSGIGLLNEKALHASLKQWYARPGDRFEVTVGGFVIDIVRDDLLIEIQTGNFASIKAKLTRLVDSHQVRLIYPIAQERWIVRSSSVVLTRSACRAPTTPALVRISSSPSVMSDAGITTPRRRSGNRVREWSISS